MSTVVSFDYTGAAQDWPVPEYVDEVTITCYGAGNGSQKGGKSTATLAVTTGDVIHLFVGGAPVGQAGGWNGGGATTDVGSGGAGATDARIGGTGLADRKVVAGGAGGTGYSGTAGGVGGGATGGTGATDSDIAGGGGGTQTGGGHQGNNSGDPRLGTLGAGQDSVQGGAGGGGLYGGGAGNAGTGPTRAGGGGGGSGLVPAGGTTTAGQGNLASGSVTIEYTLANSAPNAPTPIAPASGQVLDASTGVTFKSKYNATDGQDCNAATLRLKTGTGAYKYLDASTGTWSDTEVWNTLDTPVADGGTIEFDVDESDDLTNGNSYSWAMNTQEAGADLQGSYAADTTFVARVPPAVDITNPVDGGTVATTSPVAEWTSVLAEGTSQTKYRVVWESGDYGDEPGSGTLAADTGQVSSADGEVTCPVALDNNGTYRQFVLITETGGEDSGWEYVHFTVVVSPPATPTLTATAGTDEDTGLPTVTVAVQVDDQAPWDHTDTTVRVQASYDAGGTWATVRGASALALDDDGAASVVDYEAAFGGTCLYQAIATGSSEDGTIAGGWSTTASATLDVDGCWLIDPLDTSTALQVDVTVDDTRTRPITQDVLATLGSEDPVVSSDVRQRGRGSFTWECADLAERTALEQLLAGRNVLLQRTGAESADPGVHVYFRPLADLATDRLTQQVPTSLRDVKSAWIARPRPS